MTDSLLRRGHYVLAPTQRRDLEPALELCATDPVAYVVPAMQLEQARRTGSIRKGLWTVRRRHGLSSDFHGVIWGGSNITVALPEEGMDEADLTRAEVAQSMVDRLGRPASLVGVKEVTVDIWGRVEPWWGPARRLRTSQISMAISTPPVYSAMRPDVADLEPVRLARLTDFAALLPACVHMFTGEVGYDPLLHGRAAYEERIRSLIRLERSFVQFGLVGGKREVVFKAEVGALGGPVAQLHGVWVHPDLRGNGLAQAGLADVVAAIQATLAPTVSLYVNDFNEPALRAYEAVGFRNVGEFATVML